MTNHILVTGAAGFIGSHLCEHLLKQDANVIGIDNFDPFYSKDIKENNLKQIESKVSANSSFTFYKVSINDTQKILDLLKDIKIEMVIHLAAKAGVRPSIEDPLGYSKTNIDGTLSIMEICRVKNIKYHIFASSSSVYGNNKKVPFQESDNVDFPISPYAATKKSCELLCHTYAHLYNIHTACLRFFTVYGPRQRPDLAIHKFTKLIDAGETISMYGDGSTKRDYTYIDDIIDGILKTVKWIKKPSDKIKYEVFNLGESHTTELNKLIKVLEKSIGKSVKINRMPMQPGDVNITYANIAKSKEILGYNPQTLIEEGIPKFVEWFNSQK